MGGRSPSAVGERGHPARFAVPWCGQQATPPACLVPLSLFAGKGAACLSPRGFLVGRRNFECFGSGME